MVDLMKYRSISSQVLVEEAEALWLEVEVINREKNLFRVYNDTKEVLFKWTDCGVNSSLGLKIANDKELTYNMLSRAGLPLATTSYISKEKWDWEFDDTWFTYPLVVKPIDWAHGDGVVMNLSTHEEVVIALEKSFEDHHRMIVQNQVEWDEYRILVFQGEVIFAARRAYPYVIWDGKSTIWELIESENKSNPLRWEWYEKPLAYIKVDDELEKYLAVQLYNLWTILESWNEVFVRRNSNVWSGWVYKDVINEISETYKTIAIKATQNSELTFAWIDLLSIDISDVQWKWSILEVNATCALWWHRELTSINSAKILLEKLFSY